MAESQDSEIKNFFQHALNRTEEILCQSSTASNEPHAEVLTDVDLLERTVRLTSQLADIVTDETDLKLLDDLRMVFSELLEKFRQHFENSASRASRVTSVPSEMVKNGGPGTPSAHIPPEVLEEFSGFGFTWPGQFLNVFYLKCMFLHVFNSVLRYLISFLIDTNKPCG